MPELVKREQIIGNVHIDPTAKVHMSAIIGPNVSIGAQAKIGEGCRLSNCIILEDAEIQAHTLISCSLVGWNVKIGPWCRIEGSMRDHNGLFKLGPKHHMCASKNEKLSFSVTAVGHGAVIYPECLVYDCLVMPMYKIRKNQFN